MPMSSSCIERQYLAKLPGRVLEHILRANAANTSKYKNAERTNYDVKGIYVHASSQITQDSTDEYDFPTLSLTQN